MTATITYGKIRQGPYKGFWAVRVELGRFGCIFAEQVQDGPELAARIAEEFRGLTVSISEKLS